MPKFYEILPEATENQEAFIFDHGKTVNGVLKYKDDLTSYGWNIKQFNRVHVGAYVLSRHPGKLTKDRKFEIYAGGRVESISKPDEEGNVVAIISHPFNIIPPIKQGDVTLETYEWKSKKKKPGSWEHFWNQYGMNTISYEDFKGLLENANCVAADTEVVSDEEDLTKEDVDAMQEDDAKGFTVKLEGDGIYHKKTKGKYKGIAKRPDYDKIQKAKNKTGALGEEIVMDFLTEEAKEIGAKVPVHVSKDEGDGLGYDIRAWDAEGNEIHIEVKTSKKNYIDGFELTYNEMTASSDNKYKYYVYRIYNLNSKTKECVLKIFEGPFNDDNYKMVTTKAAVYQK